VKWRRKGWKFGRDGWKKNINAELKTTKGTGKGTSKINIAEILRKGKIN
jgi:hypothetical protein